MSKTDLSELTTLYVDVFADPPWNEYTMDKAGCGRWFGKQTTVGQICPSCGKCKLEPFYSPTETRQYIEEELDKSGANLLTVKATGTDLIGFAWGYNQTPTGFAIAKYEKPNSRPIVTQALQAAGLPADLNAYYLSEVGIKSEYRGQGTGSVLVVGLLGIAADKGLSTFLRTNKESPMVQIANKKGMRLVSNFLDPEKPARVLFTKGH